MKKLESAPKAKQVLNDFEKRGMMQCVYEYIEKTCEVADGRMYVEFGGKEVCNGEPVSHDAVYFSRGDSHQFNEDSWGDYLYLTEDNALILCMDKYLDDDNFVREYYEMLTAE